MIKVLVTGAKGQLGSSIKAMISAFNEVTFEFIDIEELDLFDLDAIELFFKENEYDYIVNCAAYTNVDKAESDIENAELLNQGIPSILAKICASQKTVLIHISTDFVFDGSVKEPLNENDLVNPLSVYGKTKFEGEEAIKKELESYFILRTSWLYSEYGNNFVKTMLRLGKDNDKLRVISDQFGTPTYASDLAEIILNIISSRNSNFGLYHFSNNGETSWHGFAKKTFNLAQLDVTVEPISSSEYVSAATRPKYSVLSKSKIRSELGIEIVDWDNSLAKCVKNLMLDQ
ncbi:dTDP-4-dehydrorhamnose reductase [Reichenbachiella agariperforans]|uniref:dTDP-4-dehydrorhamnose reductase n=1 Tax=Reichenbachiella agariperforans TaxID=156994 RepID=A0A1M6NUZ2_REIAG|nr:dTDP-4-dehydrorhamnose reductase [Reichenbachiella agariperforans]SHJ99495.1 dTDP-4-dehydrorhamnose reductase [Reichenbachiella agariperforans]